MAMVCLNTMKTARVKRTMWNIYAFVKKVFDIPSNSYQNMYGNAAAEH